MYFEVKRNDAEQLSLGSPKALLKLLLEPRPVGLALGLVLGAPSRQQLLHLLVLLLRRLAARPAAATFRELKIILRSCKL